MTEGHRTPGRVDQALAWSTDGENRRPVLLM